MDTKTEIKRTVGLSVLFFTTLLGVGLLRRQFSGIGVIKPEVVVVAFAPVLFYLLSTGKLQRFSGAGFEVAFRQQADEQLSLDSSGSITVNPIETMSKSKRSAVDNLSQLSPIALTVTLGREDYYDVESIQCYLYDVPSLQYVVFNDSKGRFEGYMKSSELKTLILRNDFDVAEIEDRSILDRNCVKKYSISRSASNGDALRQMNKHDISELVVISSSGEFAGVITQEQITRKLLSDAIETP